VLRQLSVDGLLMHEALDVPASTVAMIRKYQMPAVWINVKQRHDAVYVDEREATRRVTELLLSLGHTRIVYPTFGIDWGTGQHHYCAADRRLGYGHAMKRAGLEPWVVERMYAAEHWDHRPWGGATDDRMAVATALLSRRDRPTAVVCASIDEAMPFLLAAIGLRLRVPEDLSLVTLGHEPAAQGGIAISTLVSPLREVGFTAAAMLLDKISEPARLQRAKVIRYGEVVGSTVAPPATRSNILTGKGARR
jgi:DNA-binding LacI/PurR family transcriptional regulator